MLPCLAGTGWETIFLINGVLITLRCDFRPIENPGYAEQQPATSTACSSKGVMRVCCSYVARRSGRAAAAAAELSLPLMTLAIGTWTVKLY